MIKQAKQKDINNVVAVLRERNEDHLVAEAENMLRMSRRETKKNYEALKDMVLTLGYPKRNPQYRNDSEEFLLECRRLALFGYVRLVLFYSRRIYDDFGEFMHDHIWRSRETKELFRRALVNEEKLTEAYWEVQGDVESF